MTGDELKRRLGSEIKRRRLDRGLRREELAAHLGWSYGFVVVVEQGDSFMNADRLVNVAKFFNCRVSDLLN